MSNYKPYIISLAILIAVLVVFYFVGGIILPFIIGLLAAYIVHPWIAKLRRIIPNRSLAVTVFLLLSFAASIGTVVLFGASIVNDFKRLNGAFVKLAEENSEKIDETMQTVEYYIEQIYTSEEVQNELQSLNESADSLEDNASEVISTAMTKITSFLGSGSDGEETDDNSNDINWFVVFFTSIGYFIYILYTFPYFERHFKRYFDGDFKRMSNVQGFIQDFHRIFLHYFRQRTKIVLICMSIFLATFLIMGLPGAILIAFVAGILCYIAHFHYLALIPLSLSCWVLSVERGHSFFVYFGIVLGVFILVSILEELVLYPKLLKGYDALNPAVLTLSIALCSHFFGVVFGALIALPLTSVLLIYLDRLLMYLKGNLQDDS